jgi:hypothetical protein
MPEKRDELLRELHRWQDDIGAKHPTDPNPDFKPHAERKTRENPHLSGKQNRGICLTGKQK